MKDEAWGGGGHHSKRGRRVKTMRQRSAGQEQQLHVLCSCPHWIC